MGFLDLFRPKWKHSDPSVRLEAVKGFTSDDATELAQVVRLDRDPRVRRVALKKIDDPELLGELAVRDPDEGLRRDAAEKASELLLEAALGEDDESRSLTAVGQLSGQRALAEVACKAAFDTVQKQALGRITEDKYRADVAKRGRDAKLRTLAVEAIRDTDILRELAAGEAKEVGLLALGRLKDVESLEYVVRRAKAKAVRAAAKERLDALVPHTAAAPSAPAGAKAAGKGAVAPATNPQAAQRELLCQRLEAAAKTQDFEDADGLVASAREKWQALGSLPAADPLQKRFERAVSRYHERHDAYLKKQHKNKGNAPAPVKEAPRAQPVVAAAPQPPAPPTAEELARQAAQAAARAAEQVRQQAEAAQREQEQQRRDAAKALRDAERNQRQVEQAAQLRADEEKRAAEQKARNEQQQKNHQRLEAECLKLETLVGQDDLTLKKADQALKAAHEVIVASNPLPRETANKLRERYDNARAKLVIRIHELREGEDWNRFANVPKLQALCEKADLLLSACGQEGIELKDVAAYLKELQAEWKTVGPAPKEKSEQLWQRFKLTTDQVYEKTRAASDEERALNLKKKEELVARAESLGAGTEITDWKAATETVKNLQSEWKATGPATSAAREQVEALWVRFKTANDAFFDKRKGHYAGLDEDRAENQRKKEELIVRVERLRSSTDWKATSDQIKNLQADWKAIGPAPKEHNEALWQKFRAACDVFFEKRKLAFEKLDEERGSNQKKKEALCEKAEELAKRDDAEPDDAEAECKQLQQEWRHIGPAPKEHNEALWQRFRAACDQVFARGRGPVEMPPESADAAKFANKLPLSGLLEKMQAAAGDKAGAVAPVTKESIAVAPVVVESASAMSPSAVSGSWEKAANSGWEDIDQIISSGQTPQPDDDDSKK
jgi:hypothetical protein